MSAGKAAISQVAPNSPSVADLVVRGGRVIDTASGVDALLDVAVKDGRIAAIGPQLQVADSCQVIDARGSVVTTGLIDFHGHVYENVTGEFGLNPDVIGVRSAVTTVVDQGGASALTFDGFRRYTARDAKTRLYSFISTYLAGGLAGHKYMDLYGPNGINVAATVDAIAENRDMVCGIKCHSETAGYKEWGTTPLRMAKQMSHAAAVPVYVHLGTLWPPGGLIEGVEPGMVLDDVVGLVDKGDIIAHPFTKHPAGFVNEQGELHPLLKEAVAKGVLIDVGRGNHFSFDIARQVLDAGIVPDTLGSDLHGFNVRSIRGERWGKGGFRKFDPLSKGRSRFSYPFALTHAMSEMMALGMTLTDVIRMTTSAVAEAIGRSDEIGTLQVGRVADISILDAISGRFPLTDANRVEVIGETLVYPRACLRGGVLHQVDSPLIAPLDELQAIKPTSPEAGAFAS